LKNDGVKPYGKETVYSAVFNSDEIDRLYSKETFVAQIEIIISAN